MVTLSGTLDSFAGTTQHGGEALMTLQLVGSGGKTLKAGAILIFFFFFFSPFLFSSFFLFQSHSTSKDGRGWFPYKAGVCSRVGGLACHPPVLLTNVQ